MLIGLILAVILLAILSQRSEIYTMLNTGNLRKWDILVPYGVNLIHRSDAPSPFAGEAANFYVFQGNEGGPDLYDKGRIIEAYDADHQAVVNEVLKALKVSEKEIPADDMPDLETLRYASILRDKDDNPLCIGYDPSTDRYYLFQIG